MSSLRQQYEVPMVANAFRRCQSNRLCVKVCVLHAVSIPSRTHACLVSHQSFPHLWKKLWKITKFANHLRFEADLSQIPRGAKTRTGIKRPLAEYNVFVKAKKSPSPGANLGSKAFFLKLNEPLGSNPGANRNESES